MPGINDAPHQIEPLLAQATEAGATSIGGATLHLRGEVRDVFMGWLRLQRPDLVERYEQLYARGHTRHGRNASAWRDSCAGVGTRSPEGLGACERRPGSNRGLHLWPSRRRGRKLCSEA